MSAIPSYQYPCLAPDASGSSIYLAGVPASDEGRLEIYSINLSNINSPAATFFANQTSAFYWSSATPKSCLSYSGNQASNNSPMLIAQFGSKPYFTNVFPNRIIESPASFPLVGFASNKLFSLSGAVGGLNWITAVANVTSTATNSPWTGLRFNATAILSSSRDTGYILDKASDGATLMYSINPGLSNKLQSVPITGNVPRFASNMAAAAVGNNIVTYGSSTNGAVTFNSFDTVMGTWSGSGLVKPSTTLPSGPSTPSGGGGDGSKTPIGAIVGGIVGGLVVIALIAFLFIRHRNKKPKTNIAAHQDPNRPVAAPLMNQNFQQQQQQQALTQNQQPQYQQQYNPHQSTYIPQQPVYDGRQSIQVQQGAPMIFQPQAKPQETYNYTPPTMMPPQPEQPNIFQPQNTEKPSPHLLYNQDAYAPSHVSVDAEDVNEDIIAEDGIEDFNGRFKPGHLIKWWKEFLTLPSEVRPAFCLTAGFGSSFALVSERALVAILWGRSSNTLRVLESKVCTKKQGDDMVMARCGELFHLLFIGNKDEIRQNDHKAQTSYGKRTTTMPRVSTNSPSHGSNALDSYLRMWFTFLRQRKEPVGSSVPPTPPTLPPPPSLAMT
ncbi:hypothetical protein BGZ65_007714, partial [Modicella reniformis]